MSITPPPSEAIYRGIPGAPGRPPMFTNVPDTYTGIHRAAEAGDLNALRTALAALALTERTAAVNKPAHPAFKTSIRFDEMAKKERDLTPLQIAISKFFEQQTADQAAPYRAMVEELIRLGADLGVTTPKGSSILALAAKQASDTDSGHLEMIDLLTDRIRALPVAGQTAILEQQSGTVYHFDQSIRLSSASAFLIAAIWLKPAIAEILLPLMTDRVRTMEKDIAQDALEQLYACVNDDLCTLSAADTVLKVVDVLKVMDLLVQYGASDEKGRIADLRARFLPSLPGQPLGVAIPAALTGIAAAQALAATTSNGTASMKRVREWETDGVSSSSRAAGAAITAAERSLRAPSPAPAPSDSIARAEAAIAAADVSLRQPLDQSPSVPAMRAALNARLGYSG